MSVVSLCSLFVSVSVFLCHLVFYFAVFRSPTVSLVCFFLLRFSSSHTLVYHTENCCSPIFFIYGHTNTFLLPCCAFSLPYVRKNHTYITLHSITWWSGRMYMYYIIHVLCAILHVIHPNILHQCHHQIQWIAKMYTQVLQFRFEVFFFTLFPRFPFSLCFALHFVNVGTNHTYILSTHNHVWCMYCTLYKHFLPILVWAGVGRVGGVGEGEQKGAVVKHS